MKSSSKTIIGKNFAATTTASIQNIQTTDTLQTTQIDTLTTSLSDVTTQLNQNTAAITAALNNSINSITALATDTTTNTNNINVLFTRLPTTKNSYNVIYYDSSGTLTYGQIPKQCIVNVDQSQVIGLPTNLATINTTLTSLQQQIDNVSVNENGNNVALENTINQRIPATATAYFVLFYNSSGNLTKGLLPKQSVQDLDQSQITGLVTSLQTINNNINTNTTAITTNTTAITQNTNNIASNTSNIQTLFNSLNNYQPILSLTNKLNKTFIQNLDQSQITNLTSDLQTITNNITTNTNNITTNTASINSINTSLATYQPLLSLTNKLNKTFIQNIDQSQVTNLTTDLQTITNNITTNTNNIATNTTSIASINTSLANYQPLLSLTNKLNKTFIQNIDQSQVTNLTTDLQTITNNITTNTNNIATNTTNIAANTTSINTINTSLATYQPLLSLTNKLNKTFIQNIDQSQVTNLTTDLQTITNNITTNTNNIATNTTNIATNTTSINTINTSLANYQPLLSLTNKLDKTFVQNLDQSQVTNLTTDLATINTNLTNLSTSLVNYQPVLSLTNKLNKSFIQNLDQSQITFIGLLQALANLGLPSSTNVYLQYNSSGQLEWSTVQQSGGGTNLGTLLTTINTNNLITASQISDIASLYQTKLSNTNQIPQSYVINLTSDLQSLNTSINNLQSGFSQYQLLLSSSNKLSGAFIQNNIQQSQIVFTNLLQKLITLGNPTAQNKTIVSDASLNLAWADYQSNNITLGTLLTTINTNNSITVSQISDISSSYQSILSTLNQLPQSYVQNLVANLQTINNNITDIQNLFSSYQLKLSLDNLLSNNFIQNLNMSQINGLELALTNINTSITNNSNQITQVDSKFASYQPLLTTTNKLDKLYLSNIDQSQVNNLTTDIANLQSSIINIWPTGSNRLLVKNSSGNASSIGGTSAYVQFDGNSLIQTQSFLKQTRWLSTNATTGMIEQANWSNSSFTSLCAVTSNNTAAVITLNGNLGTTFLDGAGFILPLQTQSILNETGAELKFKAVSSNTTMRGIGAQSANGNYTGCISGISNNGDLVVICPGNGNGSYASWSLYTSYQANAMDISNNNSIVQRGYYSSSTWQYSVVSDQNEKIVYNDNFSPDDLLDELSKINWRSWIYKDGSPERYSPCECDEQILSENRNYTPCFQDISHIKYFNQCAIFEPSQQKQKVVDWTNFNILIGLCVKQQQSLIKQNKTDIDNIKQDTTNIKQDIDAITNQIISLQQQHPPTNFEFVIESYNQRIQNLETTISTQTQVNTQLNNLISRNETRISQLESLVQNLIEENATLTTKLNNQSEMLQLLYNQINNTN